MDKYEYKIRADEIKALIEEGEFAEAVKIADTIDWRRVRSVMMLCTVSDLYKINRRYQESKDILLLAYEKNPSGRAIVYSLCELSIKMEEYIQAVEYYKEFVQIAPKDTGKYVLLYRLYEAQDVSLEERIAVLEEFKKRDYREKWAYELAYLYHRIGLTTKCIEECDEMYLWFGEGKYVLKAMELKALHVPLNAEQQVKYDTWIKQRDEDVSEEAVAEEEEEQTSEEEETDLGLQETPDKTADSDTVSDTEDSDIMSIPTTELPEVKTVDVGQYNTINLQMVVAEGLKELLPEETEDTAETENAEETESHETPQTEKTDEEDSVSITEQLIAPLLQETLEMPEVDEAEKIEPQIANAVAQDVKPESTQSHIKYDDVLSQENDGQIRLVVPDVKVVEKQITGQLSIEDIMAEWEEMKKSNEQKRMEDVRRLILSRTGSLFADFDEATQNGLLEELEQAFVAAIIQDKDKESAIKKVIHPIEAELELDDSLKTQLQQAVSDAVSEATVSMLAEDDVEESPLDETDEVEELEEIIEQEEDESDEVTLEPPRQEDPKPVRELTDEENELFGRYVQHKKSKEQLINALDNMSMAAYTGNIIITGEEDGATMPLAKSLIREMQYSDSNFSGKVAKISAAALNKKEISDTLKRLSNGALIIEKAADLNAEVVTKLNKVLENENIGLLLIIEDTKKRIDGLLSDNAVLNNCFNLRIDIEPLDDEALVAYAKQYAEENEYSIDEFGVLALHTRIADMQTLDHEVSVSEVRELVDDAIYYANKKTPRHFFDILLAKRYDEEDMIILRERDFMHY